jgi:putative ABC transport system permease protein
MSAYLNVMVLFYKRHLRVQPMRELMAVAGVAAGVALFFAVQVAHRSLTGSFQEISRGVAGRATLELAARGPEGFDEAITEQVQRMGEVRAAAAIFQQPVVAVGPKGKRALTLVGANEQITALDGKLSLAFQHAAEASQRGPLILSASTASAIGVQPGQEVRVLVGERSFHLTLDAALGASKLGLAAEAPIAAAPLPTVQSIAGAAGRVSRVLIEVKPGKETALLHALQARFGGKLNVRGTGTEAKLLGNAAGPETQITLLFGVISVVAGIILAFNALLLASDERRRFIAYLLETGTPEGMIVASLLFDALILGVVGSLLGLLAGDLVSLFAYRAVPGYIAAAFAVGGGRIIDAQTIVVALAGGMLAGLVAAGLPALMMLRASAAIEPHTAGRTLSLTRKLHPADALLPAGGASLVVFSILLSLLLPAGTVVALVGIVAGLVICLPALTRGVLKLAYLLSQHSNDVSAHISAAELQSAPTRSVALLATGVVAAFLMVLIGGSVADVQHAARKGASDLLSSGELWVKPGGAENVYTTQRFNYLQTQKQLQQAPGVASVLPWRDSFLDIPNRRVWVLGVPRQVAAQIAPSQIVNGNLTTADDKIRAGGWVAISEPIAREKHLHLGDQFILPTPAGSATVRLAATIANYGWLPGAIVMNAGEHQRLWPGEPASELAVSLKPGVTLTEGKSTVERALPAGSALTVKTAAERRVEVSAVIGSTLSRLNDTALVVLIAAISSVIALMVAPIWQRRERVNALISVGMSPAQFARQTGAVLLCGCLVGVVGGLLGQYLIDGWLCATTGASVHDAPAWQLGIATLAIALAISATASVVAVAQTRGFQPRAAFQTE